MERTLLIFNKENGIVIVIRYENISAAVVAAIEAAISLTVVKLR